MQKHKDIEMIKMQEKYEVYTIKGEYGIIDTTIPRETGERVLITVPTETKARIIVEELNKLQHQVEEKPLDLHKDFTEYDELISRITKTSKRLIELEEIYKEESKLELQQAIEDKIDFKKLYGGNNEKTRKQYVDEQLKTIVIEKTELKIQKEDDLRRIEFLKRIIDMKTELIKYTGE